MSARDDILGRVRAALTDVPADEQRQVDWQYGRATPLASVIDTFAENIDEYGARLTRVAPDDLPGAMAAALTDAGARSVVVPHDLDESWLSEVRGLMVVPDHGQLTARELDGIDAVVTASLVSSAETGTICLDHGVGQGRRAISLVPDIHVCVVAVDSVVSDIPEAVARLHASAAAGRPITWISGGSATSDIELDRVEGVHGPRRLHVLLVG
ncbi:LutC/YkgG family protein [Aestuariimicrobium soli]|uniref:LutC/YkgG family protein n=1 Tax=Aestuariimicrobium soli TaxID=2035834 RepID=UPI003EBB0B0E